MENYTFENLRQQTAFIDLDNREEILSFERKEELAWYIDNRINKLNSEIEDKNISDNERVTKTLTLNLLQKIRDGVSKLL
ncbi:MAG: hypothetical protein ACFN00_06235 [Flavobacteriaceae bacterium]